MFETTEIKDEITERYIGNESIYMENHLQIRSISLPSRLVEQQLLRILMLVSSVEQLANISACFCQETSTQKMHLFTCRAHASVEAQANDCSSPGRTPEKRRRSSTTRNFVPAHKSTACFYRSNLSEKLPVVYQPPQDPGPSDTYPELTCQISPFHRLSRINNVVICCLLEDQDGYCTPFCPSAAC